MKKQTLIFLLVTSLIFGPTPFTFAAQNNFSQNDWSQGSFSVTNIKTSTPHQLTLNGKSWLDENWTHRQRATINNTQNHSNLSEYQILVEIDSATLILAGKINADCSDLRFATDNQVSLPYFIFEETCNTSSTKIWVQVDDIAASSNETLYIYYGNPLATAQSSLADTFTYSTSKPVGVVFDSQSLNSDLSVISLEDSNTIENGTSTLNLDEQQTGSFASGELSVGTTISAKKLFYAGTNDETADMIAPLSFAGTLFLHYSDRDNHQYQIYSHFADASVTVYLDGISVFNGTINQGTATTVNTGSYNDKNVRIESDVPVHVHHYAGAYDSLVLYPATDDDLYGIPSNSLQLAAGTNGAHTSWVKHDGSSVNSPQILAANGIYTLDSLGAQGLSGAFKVSSDQPIGVTQLADSDGGESTAFWPVQELGTKFGANSIAQYIAVAAPYANTSCTITDALQNQPSNPAGGYNNPHTGGASAVNFLYFGESSTSKYSWLSAGWKMECDKPVYAYYENEDGTSSNQSDEHNLWSYPQMRQMTYPEPSINSINTEEGRFETWGSLESNIIKGAASGNLWDTLSFVTDDTANSVVKVRTGLNDDLSDAPSFSSCSSLINQQDISTNNCVSDQDVYFQYQITLTGDSYSSPLFTQVSLNYDRVKTPVKAVLKANSFMVGGRRLQLDGSSSQGFNLTYNWAIIKGEGSLSDPLAAQPELTVPTTQTAKSVEILLTVTDPDLQRDTQRFTLSILPSYQGQDIDTQIGGVATETGITETISVDDDGSEVLSLQIGEATIYIGAPDTEYTLAFTKDRRLVIGLPAENNNTGAVYLFNDPIDEIAAPVRLNEESIIQISQEVNIPLLQIRTIKDITVGETDYFVIIRGNEDQGLFGQYLATGDLNDDGIDEIIISAPNSDQNGRVYIYDSETELSGVIIGTELFPLDSILVENLLDSTGDDLFFGPQNYSLNQNLTRRDYLDSSSSARLFSLGSHFDVAGVTILDDLFISTEIDIPNGLQSFASGDFNQDGQMDIVISDSQGQVALFYGPLMTDVQLNISQADLTITHSQGSSYFGQALAIGDVNGDNEIDLIIGDPARGENQEGAITVLLGNETIGTNIDVATSPFAFDVLGNVNQAQIGADLLLSDQDKNGASEIYSLSGGTSFAIDLLSSGSANTQGVEDPESQGTPTEENQAQGSSSGCHLNPQAMPHTGLWTLIISFIGPLILFRRRKTE